MVIGMDMKPTDKELEARAEWLDAACGCNLEGSPCMSEEACRMDAETAAMLRACKGRARVKVLEWRKSERGFRWEETACGSYVIFYKSEGSATLSHGATTVTVAEYDGDNMGVKCKAAAQADYEARILSALEPAPDNEQWNAAIEAAAKVADQMPNLDHPSEAIAAIRALKKGQTDD